MPNNRTIENLIHPAEIADATEGGHLATDLLSYQGDVDFILQARNTAGSTPTLNVKLQSGELVSVESSEIYTTEGENVHDVELREGATTNVKIGAAFTKSGTASIREVYLQLKKNGTVTTTDLTLTIEADSAGDPSGTALGTATVSTDDITSSYTFIKFTFNTPVDLTDTSDYWLVLVSDYTASATNNIAWQADSGLSSGGNQSLHNNTSWTADADDSQIYYMKEIVFADTGSAFTEVTTGSAQADRISIDARSIGRYVRAHSTVTGTSTPAYEASLVLVGQNYV